MFVYEYSHLCGCSWDLSILIPFLLTGWWFGAGLFVLFFCLRSASDSFYSISEDELGLGEMREVYALVSGL